jgi:hypothetical protein
MLPPIEFDQTPLDIITETNDGKLRRPVIAILVDVYSRAVFAMAVTEGAVDDPNIRSNEQASQSLSKECDYKAAIERLFSNINLPSDDTLAPNDPPHQKTSSEIEEED